ncbi:uncharacterized protein EDB91DRAFT_1235578 [Suillus paluster]|uniref:uncharacterized protein n=1 Tax=Suillus paluster TaxID=48578 RepID=UPI001B886B79|nr:uncharacterized protein EDB91DRAFT_1235578 [Suillus paluster]KAG1749069.1 hypothetical protein EDB91DRAFT_1235578 [Suillus paluster]
MLLPDTAPVPHHTLRTDYRTGDLKLGHIAVLADLRRYLQVPFDCLMKCVGAMPSQQDLQWICHNLTECKILTDNESGLQWTDFTPPATSKGSEENVFKPLGRIIIEILVQVPNSAVSFLANPNGTPLSQCNNTFRPDGYLVLSNKKTEPKIHWFNIAVPFEFKKGWDICYSLALPDLIREDKQKIIWSLHSIMREDLLRRFVFSITIEDMQLRLWLSNHAFLAVTEPIDIFKLGWDPTVKWICDGKDFQYKFTIGDEVFTTTRELATYGADSMVGRGTRVYEATDAKGKKVAIKDSWREELADAERHFIGVWLWKDVIINDTRDKTLDPMVSGEHNRTWEWVSINSNPILSMRPHLPSTGDVPDSGWLSPLLPTRLGSIARNDTGIPRRVHTCTVFHDVRVAVNDVTSLADILSCLLGALKALQYMHKAGWVHRDFSIGNTIWVGGIGKLGDFEYAKKIDSNTSHDVRMGTMHFMALEVESQKYLFCSDPDSLPFNTDLPSDIPFHMNFLHDIESIWWVFTWIFFYHMDTESANTGHSFDTQWEQFQLAFPGAVGCASRWHFFNNLRKLHKSCQTVLSKTCFDVCHHIPHFAKALQDGYRKVEANYPELALDDTLLEDMHGRAAEFLRDARERAGVIQLCLLPNFQKQKRPRPGDETLPPPGKKPQHD